MPKLGRKGQNNILTHVEAIAGLETGLGVSTGLLGRPKRNDLFDLVENDNEFGDFDDSDNDEFALDMREVINAGRNARVENTAWAKILYSCIHNARLQFSNFYFYVVILYIVLNQSKCYGMFITK